jgi:hypothetical protein
VILIFARRDYGALGALKRRPSPRELAVGDGANANKSETQRQRDRRRRIAAHHPGDEFQASGITREPDPAIYSYDARNRRWVVKEGVR